MGIYKTPEGQYLDLDEKYSQLAEQEGWEKYDEADAQTKTDVSGGNGGTNGSDGNRTGQTEGGAGNAVENGGNEEQPYTSKYDAMMAAEASEKKQNEQRAAGMEAARSVMTRKQPDYLHYEIQSPQVEAPKSHLGENLREYSFRKNVYGIADASRRNVEGTLSGLRKQNDELFTPKGVDTGQLDLRRYPYQNLDAMRQMVTSADMEDNNDDAEVRHQQTADNDKQWDDLLRRMTPEQTYMMAKIVAGKNPQEAERIMSEHKQFLSKLNPAQAAMVAMRVAKSDPKAATRILQGSDEFRSSFMDGYRSVDKDARALHTALSSIIPGVVKEQRDEAEKGFSEDVNNANPYTMTGAIFSAARKYNENIAPSVAINRMEAYLQDFFDVKKHPENAEYVNSLMAIQKKTGMPVEDVMSQVVYPQIYQEVWNECIKQNMPKNDIEWIVRNISNSLIGKVSQIASMNLETRQMEQQSLGLYGQHNAGWFSSFASTGVNFMADLPAFGAFGKAAGWMTRPFLSGNIAANMASGMTKENAVRVAMNEMQGTALGYGYQMLNSGLTFAQFDTANNIIDQYSQTGTVDLSEVPAAFGKGLAVGGVLSVMNMALAKYAPETFWKRTGYNAFGAGLETMLFASVSGLEQIANGEDVTWWDNILSSSQMVGWCRAHSCINRKRQNIQAYNESAKRVGAASYNELPFFHKDNFFNGDMKDNKFDVLTMHINPKMKKQKVSARDVEVMNRAGYAGDNFFDIVRSIAHEVEVKKKDPTEIFNNPAIPRELSAKFLSYVTGVQYQALPSVMTNAPVQMEDGRWMVTDHDMIGCVNHEYVFKDAVEASEFAESRKKVTYYNRISELQKQSLGLYSTYAIGNAARDVAYAEGIETSDMLKLWREGSANYASLDESQRAMYDKMMELVGRYKNPSVDPKALRTDVEQRFKMDSGELQRKIAMMKTHPEMLTNEDMQAISTYVRLMDERLSDAGKKFAEMNGGTVMQENSATDGNNMPTLEEATVNDIAFNMDVNLDNGLHGKVEGNDGKYVRITLDDGRSIRLRVDTLTKFLRTDPETGITTLEITDANQAVYDINAKRAAESRGKKMAISAIENNDGSLKEEVARRNVMRQRCVDLLGEEATRRLEEDGELALTDDVTSDEARIIRDYLESRDIVNSISGQLDESFAQEQKQADDVMRRMQPRNGSVYVMTDGKSYWVIRNQSGNFGEKQTVVRTRIDMNEDGTIGWNTFDPNKSETYKMRKGDNVQQFTEEEVMKGLTPQRESARRLMENEPSQGDKLLMEDGTEVTLSDFDGESWSAVTADGKMLTMTADEAKARMDALYEAPIREEMRLADEQYNALKAEKEKKQDAPSQKTTVWRQGENGLEPLEEQSGKDAEEGQASLEVEKKRVGPVKVNGLVTKEDGTMDLDNSDSEIVYNHVKGIFKDKPELMDKQITARMEKSKAEFEEAEKSLKEKEAKLDAMEDGDIETWASESEKLNAERDELEKKRRKYEHWKRVRQLADMEGMTEEERKADEMDSPLSPKAKKPASPEMTERQRKRAENNTKALEGILKADGIETVFFDDEDSFLIKMRAAGENEDNVRRLVQSGRWRNVNGFYLNGKIYVNRMGARSADWVFGHETTHYISQHTPGGFEAFRDAILKTFSTEEIGRKLEQYRDTYKILRPEITDKELLEEIAADEAGNLIMNPRFMKRFLRENAPGVIESIKAGNFKDAMIGVWNNVATVIDRFRTSMADEDKQRYSNAFDMWTDALKQAVGNDKWSQFLKYTEGVGMEETKMADEARLAIQIPRSADELRKYDEENGTQISELMEFVDETENGTKKLIPSKYNGYFVVGNIGNKVPAYKELRSHRLKDIGGEIRIAKSLFNPDKHHANDEHQLTKDDWFNSIEYIADREEFPNLLTAMDNMESGVYRVYLPVKHHNGKDLMLEVDTNGTTRNTVTVTSFGRDALMVAQAIDAREKAEREGKVKQNIRKEIPLLIYENGTMRFLNGGGKNIIKKGIQRTISPRIIPSGQSAGVPFDGKGTENNPNLQENLQKKSSEGADLQSEGSKNGSLNAKSDEALPENYAQIIKEGVERYTERKSSEDAMTNNAIMEYCERSLEAGKMNEKDVNKILKKHGLPTMKEWRLNRDAEEINAEQGGAKLSIVTDEAEIEKLESEELVPVYRAMIQGEDGKLYAPMSSKGVRSKNGKVVMVPIEFGQWEKSEEHPEIAIMNDGDDYAHVTINDDAGGSTPVAYNPYLHTSMQMLNDQFAKSWRRPNMVVVECLVPKSEAEADTETSYKADMAKNHVGPTQEWNSGPVSKRFEKKKRTVVLSRWAKPMGIVGMDEYAKSVKKLLEDNDVLQYGVPFSHVTPAQRDALYEAGVPITAPEGSGKNEKSMEAYREWEKGLNPGGPDGGGNGDGEPWEMPKDNPYDIVGARSEWLKNQQQKKAAGDSHEAELHGTMTGKGKFSMTPSKSEEEFRQKQKLAVENVGIVNPNLKDEKFDIIELERHPFTGTGKQALESARKWAVDNLVGVHKENEGAEDEYSYYIDEDTIGKYLSESSTKSSDNLGLHISSLIKLKEIIKKSIDSEQHPSYKKVNGKRAASNGVGNDNEIIHRLYGAAKMDDVIYRVKTTMKEHVNYGNEPYDYKITKIESPISGHASDNALGETTFVTAAKLLKDVEKSYDLGKKLIENDEKNKNKPSFSIESAEKDVNTNPSEAQKEAGNYKMGHAKVDGFDITIENPKGSVRSGKDADGKEWSVKMNYTYGYIRGTKGVDGDHIDVYLNDKPGEKVFVVDQINQKTGEFDEHKVMYGFNSLDEATEAYLSQYEKGWKVGKVTEVSKEYFKEWVNSSKRKTKAFSEYKRFAVDGHEAELQGTVTGKGKLSITPSKEWKDAMEEMKGDRDAEEHMRMMEAQNIEEVASEVLAGTRLMWSDEGYGEWRKKGMASELGWGEGERRKFLTMIATSEKGGKTLAEVGEMIEQACRDQNIAYDDDGNAGRNAALSVLQQCGNAGAVRNYIMDNRIYEAKQMHDEYLQREEEFKAKYEEERDKHYMEEYGMTFEEYEAMRAKQNGGDGSHDAGHHGTGTDEGKNTVAKGGIKNPTDEEIHRAQWYKTRMARQAAQIQQLEKSVESYRKAWEAERSRANGELAKSNHYQQTQAAVEQKAKIAAKNAENFATAYQQLVEVKKQLTNYVKEQLQSDWMPNISKRELNKIMSAIQRTNTPAQIEKAMRDVQAVAAQGEVNYLNSRIDRMMRLKTQDVNGKNMSVAKTVDERTRKIMNAIKDRAANLKVTGLEDQLDEVMKQRRELRSEINRLIDEGEDPKSDSIKGMEMEWRDLSKKVRDIEAQIEEAQENKMLMSNDELNADLDKLEEKAERVARGEEGVEWTDDDTDQMTILKTLKVMNDDRERGKSVFEVNKQLRELYASNEELRAKWKDANAFDKKTLRNQINHNNEVIESLQLLRTEALRNHAESLGNSLALLENIMEVGRNNLRALTANEIMRKMGILRKSFQDVKKNPFSVRDPRLDPNSDKSKRSMWREMLSLPLNSFERQCRKIGRSKVNGDGFLYQYFIKGEHGVMEAYNTYSTGIRAQKELLNEKVKEVFGTDFFGNTKEKLFGTDYWTHMQEKSESGDKLDLEIVNKDGYTELHKLTKGQAAYLYGVWKMNDGKAALINEGYNDESMDRIMDFIGPEYMALVDWLQDDFLIQSREKYNERYLEMYNTSMARVENYIPLRRLSSETRNEVDMTGDKKNVNDENAKLNSRNGSLINRTVNNIKVSHENLFDLIGKHVQEMESWYAYSPVRRDLDYVLNSKYFQNQVDVNNPGDFKRFREAAQVAVELYNPKDSGKMDEIMGWISKRLAGSAIAYNLTPAIKQLESYIAYYGYDTNPAYFYFLEKNTAKGLAGQNIAWCKRNLPSFRDRVDMGNLGDYRVTEHIDGLSRKMQKVDKTLGVVQSAGTLPNKGVDALTVSIGAKAIYDYNMWKMRKAIDNDIHLTDEAREQKLKEAHRVALMEADLYYNGTQQSSHPAFMSPFQKSKSSMARAFTLFKNSSLGFTRKGERATADIFRTIAGWRRIHENYVKDYMEEEDLSREEAESRATSTLRHHLGKNLVEAAIFNLLIKYGWDFLGYDIYNMLTSDGEDEEDTMTTGEKLADATKFALYPIQGVPLETVVTGILSGHGFQTSMAPTEIENIAEDIAKLFGDNVNQSVVNDLINRASKFAIGVDLGTLSTEYTGLMGLVKDGYYDIAGEAWLDVFTMIKAPVRARDKAVDNLCKKYGWTMEEYIKMEGLARGYMTDDVVDEGGIFTLELDTKKMEQFKKRYDELHGKVNKKEKKDAREAYNKESTSDDKFSDLAWKDLGEEIRANAKMPSSITDKYDKRDWNDTHEVEIAERYVYNYYNDEIESFKKEMSLGSSQNQKILEKIRQLRKEYEEKREDPVKAAAEIKEYKEELKELRGEGSGRRHGGSARRSRRR